MFRLLLIALVAAFFCVSPVEVLSLGIAMFQLLVSIFDFIDKKEEIPMKNMVLMVSGTHGVVQYCFRNAAKALTSAE